VDLSADIVYNGLTIAPPTPTGGGGPMSGYSIDELQQSNVDVVAFMEQRAVHDGLDSSDVFLGRRLITAIVTVYGSTKGDFWDKAQDLLAAFSPTLAYNADTANNGFLPFKFYQPTADISTWPLSSFPNGIPMQYYLRPFDTPTYLTRRSTSGGESGKGLSEKFSVTLVAQDPRKYSQALVTSGATNLGDYPTYPTFTITTTTATTGTVTFTIGSNTLSVSINASSSTYVIDCDKQTIYKNGSLAMSLDAGQGLWYPRFDPGVNSLVVGGTSAGLTVARSFRHAWA
jgi:hypothetical protein